MQFPISNFQLPIGNRQSEIFCSFPAYNPRLQLTIEKLVYGGDGLARLPADELGPGKAVFVPFVLEGERIEASLLEQKRGFARGRADAILQASPQRVEPRCPYFQRCGGCHYQHARYEHQLEIKAAILKETLRRVAKLELGSTITIHPSPPWNYRNRTRLKVRTAPEFALGYYKFNSHELLPIEECPISSPLINRAITAFWQMGRGRTVPDGIQEIEFFANADDTQLLIEASCEPGTPITPARDWAETARSTLSEISGVVVFQAKSSSRTDEPKQIAASGAEELTYKTNEASFLVSAGAFFQVNRHLINELAEIVVEQYSGARALDLYAGVGLFSTLLSRRFAQVIAVESSQTSHTDLLHNSPVNVKAVRATTADFLRSATGKLRPDLVVVDPPRSGLGETVVQSLAGLGAHRMTYISCDPATASRDLAGLLSAGYRLEQAHLVDLFPQTYHLESVFHLSR
jgi:23S rRNA (uracil1939-C5)-methyltransferase